MLKMLRHWLDRVRHPWHSPDCPPDCTRDVEERADKQLHDMATRLHVLEWEAYGHRKKRGETQ